MYIRESKLNQIKYYKRNGLRYGRSIYIEMQNIPDVNWINVIAEMKTNGFFVISSKFQIESYQLTLYQHPLFNQIITNKNKLATLKRLYLPMSHTYLNKLLLLSLAS